MLITKYFIFNYLFTIFHQVLLLLELNLLFKNMTFQEYLFVECLHVNSMQFYAANRGLLTDKKKRKKKAATVKANKKNSRDDRQ